MNIQYNTNNYNTNYNVKNCTPPETAIIYTVKKQIVATISTAGTTLLSWNKTNIFHGYKVRI